jgi:tRNA (adenine37-N6)-methyltransferase
VDRRSEEAMEGPIKHLVRPIGVIRSPYTEVAGTPIQTIYGRGIEGDVVVRDEYESALADIEGFERLWLIYWLDRAGPFKSRIMPYRDAREHGLFATRAPCRPNPIGISVVRLLGREGNKLHIADLDILDGTSLLDIKPYVPMFDVHLPSAAGWFDVSGVERQVADDRF